MPAHVPQHGTGSSGDPGAAWPALKSVARHSFPRVLEATLVPTALLYGGLSIWGSVWPGAVAALVWAVAAMAVRAAHGRRVTALLGLAVMGLAVRTGFALVAHSSYIYFLQPIVVAAVISAVFLVSLGWARPMVARLAHDFCPLPEGADERPRVRVLLRRLTALWGVVNATNAGVTLWLLSTMSLSTFLAVKTVVSIAMTAAATTITVAGALRVSRSEGLHTAIAAGGRYRLAMGT